MRLVLAAADRDFLAAYAKWFADRGYPAETVFDAVQLKTALAGDGPSLCVLDERLPLLPHADVMALLEGAGWQVITLRTERAPGGAAEANTLYYPFTPRELLRAAAPWLAPTEERQATARDENP